MILKQYCISVTTPFQLCTAASTLFEHHEPAEKELISISYLYRNLQVLINTITINEKFVVAAVVFHATVNQIPFSVGFILMSCSAH